MAGDGLMQGRAKTGLVTSLPTIGRQAKKQRVLVVLGMHRSGTSAITRGLMALGVKLGNRLISSKPDNQKGFWEDIDLTELNADVLHFAGSAWDSLNTPTPIEDDARLSPLMLRAVELVRAKIQDDPLWGFKDPRTPRLLFFWKKVFAHLDIDVGFVIAVRNPLSVARSLKERNGFDAERSHYLWLEHIVPSVRETEGYPRVVVDYDLLMDEPERQIRRIGERLGFAMTPDPAEMGQYKSEFLDEGLRHTQFAPEDLRLDAAAPAPMIEAYELLRRVATDELSLDAPAVSSAFAGFEEHLRHIAPAKQFIARLESRLQESLHERNAQVTALHQEVAVRDLQIGQRDQQLAERGAAVSRLERLIAERDVEVAKLHQILSERDAEIFKLHQIAGKRDAEVGRLEIEVGRLQVEVDRFGGEVGRLEALARERNEEAERLSLSIAQLTLALAERDSEIAAIHNTFSWRLTQPLRAVRRSQRAFMQAEPTRFMIGAVSQVRSATRRLGWFGFLKRLPYFIKHRRVYLEALKGWPPAGDSVVFAGPTPAAPQPVRLHPDLAGNIEPIDKSISVVIPTLNAGAEFRFLLRKLKSQQGLRELEVVIVDSGSTDQTVALARQAGCTVVEIAQKDFSHSYARNKGAEAATGDYVLFMVQDAYPVGDHWAYGMLRYLLDHESQKLIAVSCAEFSRSDSDIMYDSMIDTHYRFLGCNEYDRIGELGGEDHVSLRSKGQLSDVSCLIGRDVFHSYRYQGDYAEDLDLGIRLIKDGYRVAMLSSVRTIHSHNRPAYYYLKRSFVDVVFLVGMFDDFTYPQIDSPRGLFAGIASTAAHLSAYLADGEASIAGHHCLDVVYEDLRHQLQDIGLGVPCRLGEKALDAYIENLGERFLEPDTPLTKAEMLEAQRFVDSFLARLKHFNEFGRRIYPETDATVHQEVRDGVRKVFAATAGSMLGFMYMNYAKDSGPKKEMVETLKAELKAGI